MKEIVGASLDTGSKIALETNHFVSIVFRSLSFKSSSSAGITLFSLHPPNLKKPRGLETSQSVASNDATKGTTGRRPPYHVALTSKR